MGLFDDDIFGTKPKRRKKKNDLFGDMDLGFDFKGFNITDKYDDKKKKRKPIPQGMQKDLLIRCKGKCEKCKSSLKGLKPDIHHKNQNPGDNRKANLIVLCPNCHRKAHHKDGKAVKPKSKKPKKKKDSLFGDMDLGFGAPKKKKGRKKKDDIFGGSLF